MNLILLQKEDFIDGQRAVLAGRRLRHVLEIHQAIAGQTLRVGLLNGQMGEGLILEACAEKLILQVSLTQTAPPPLPVTLLLALPRPKMLKRILQAVSSLGVKHIYLLNSYRVEKSFWGSPLLQPEALQEQLILGLEQARDTLLPRIHLRPRFKPFVEDDVPALIRGTQALVAHPTAGAPCPVTSHIPTTLAIGPEGGFIPYEIEKLQQCGFTPVSLGERILRVETAVAVLLSRFR